MSNGRGWNHNNNQAWLAKKNDNSLQTQHQSTKRTSSGSFHDATSLSFVTKSLRSFIDWANSLFRIRSPPVKSPAQALPVWQSNVNFEFWLPACFSLVYSQHPLWQEMITLKYKHVRSRQTTETSLSSSWKSSNPVEATRSVLHHGSSCGNQCTPKWNGNLDRWGGGMWPRRLVKIDVLILPLTNICIQILLLSGGRFVVWINMIGWRFMKIEVIWTI